MKEPTHPTYWELLKKLLDDIKSIRALDDHGDHIVIRIEEDKRQLVKFFCDNRKGINKARLQNGFDELVWDLRDDERMWKWLTRRGGHYDYIRNDRIVETPEEIYRAYCKRYKIDVPLPGQETLKLF